METQIERKHGRNTIEKLLCNWDFCDVCINARIRAGIPRTNLKSDGVTPPYFRVKHPEWRPTQPRKYKQ